MRLHTAFLILTLAPLAGCVDPYPATPNPDYTIRVMPGVDGMVALPPDCPPYATSMADPYDNQPIPQFGCASARNLALSVEQPEDLLRGRELGPANGVTAVGSMLRYTNNQTRGLIDSNTSTDLSPAVTTASTATSSITGEVTSPGGSASSSSSSSSRLRRPLGARSGGTVRGQA